MIRDLEMLKGIRGLTNQDVHVLPVIDNTAREQRARGGDGRGACRPALRAAWGVLVRDHGCYIWGADIWEAKRHTEVYHYLFEAVVARHDRGRPLVDIRGTHSNGGSRMTASHDHDHYLCPTCQQHIPHAKIDVVDVAKAVEADKLTEADVFKRTYLGHGTQSSVFVFQGHPGPFRTHVHTTHDEIGYVLEGTGQVTVGGVTRPVKKGDVWVIPPTRPTAAPSRTRPRCCSSHPPSMTRTTRTGSGSTTHLRTSPATAVRQVSPAPSWCPMATGR